MAEKPADIDLEGLGYVAYPFTLHGLQHAVDARNRLIDPMNKLGTLFFTVEFAGEAGEACNKIKKLERERLDIAGSRTTVEAVGDELADAIITACNLARTLDINLDKHIVDVFNRTSEERRISIRLHPITPASWAESETSCMK